MTPPAQQQPGPDAPPAGIGAFVARTFVVVLVAGLALLAWRLRDALTIGLGAVVLGLGFSGLSDAVVRRLGLPRPLALAMVVAATLGLVGTSLEIFGATLAAQFDTLGQKLPESLRTLQAQLDRGPIGPDLLRQARAGTLAAITGSGPRAAAVLIVSLAKTATYLLVMLAGGVFLAIDPARYRRGLLALVPRRRRARYGEVLSILATSLRRWLLAKLILMSAVGVLSSLALWALGVEAPVALGLTGGILSIIPHLGSVLATLPAMLVAFLQDPIKAVLVAVAIWAVHFVEGNVISPYVQDEVVDVPPAVSVFSTVVFAVLLGPVAVFLTGPITVIAIVLVQRLYIEDVLGEALEPRRRRAPPRMLAGVFRALGRQAQGAQAPPAP
ncbi:MAG TPA: AI-2E family transporter [Caulobacteraceae bacterium]|nr:AI-2E family transporter [Caulobacteraceae bacterium]